MGLISKGSQVEGHTRLLAKTAFRFVVVIGITSLFADFTHEAAHSINGQFLATLGASAAVVGFTAVLVNSPAMDCVLCLVFLLTGRAGTG